MGRLVTSKRHPNEKVAPSPRPQTSFLHPGHCVRKFFPSPLKKKESQPWILCSMVQWRFHTRQGEQIFIFSWYSFVNFLIFIIVFHSGNIWQHYSNIWSPISRWVAVPLDSDTCLSFSKINFDKPALEAQALALISPVSLSFSQIWLRLSVDFTNSLHCTESASLHN